VTFHPLKEPGHVFARRSNSNNWWDETLPLQKAWGLELLVLLLVLLVCNRLRKLLLLPCGCLVGVFGEHEIPLPVVLGELDREVEIGVCFSRHYAVGKEVVVVLAPALIVLQGEVPEVLVVVAVEGTWIFAELLFAQRLALALQPQSLCDEELVCFFLEALLILFELEPSVLLDKYGLLLSTPFNLRSTCKLFLVLDATFFCFFVLSAETGLLLLSASLCVLLLLGLLD
jgi:hypothetical protein